MGDTEERPAPAPLTTNRSLWEVKKNLLLGSARVARKNDEWTNLGSTFKRRRLGKEGIGTPYCAAGDDQPPRIRRSQTSSGDGDVPLGKDSLTS